MTRPWLLASLFGVFGLLPAAAQPFNVLSEEERIQGFELLFDGTREGFNRHFVDYIKGDSTNVNLSTEWAVADSTGAIGIMNNTEDVRSRRKYRDFDLRLDYRNTHNQGIFYRSLVNTERAWQTGFEYAIYNNSQDCRSDCAGSAYDLYRPVAGVYRLYKTLEWNQVRILVAGDSVEHWMNGVKMLGFRIHSEDFWKTFAMSKWNSDKRLSFKTPGNQAGGYIEEGYIGLQADHGGKWEIRNMRIRELDLSVSIRPIRKEMARAPRAGRGGFFAGRGMVLLPIDKAGRTDLAGRISTVPLRPAYPLLTPGR